MPLAEATSWSERLRGTLERYDEGLLRQVAARLVKPRNQWPVEDLIARILATVDNPAVIDRRLQELGPAGRQLLALLGHSRQPRWALGHLVELLLTLGHEDGLAPVFDLLAAGLLYPILPTQSDGTEDNPDILRFKPSPGGRVKSFEQWLAYPGAPAPEVFTLPLVAARALGEDLGLPDLSKEDEGRPSVSFSEADGLEWLLRLAVLWQQAMATPLRRTQQGGFFKRDLERLGQDPLLAGPPSDRLAEVPDAGFLTAELAEMEGILQETDSELRGGKLPAAWEADGRAALEALWADLPRLRAWNPLDGWRADAPAGNPFPSAGLLAFMLLARLPEGAAVRPATLEAWLLEHHPYWQNESLRPSRQQPWLEAFLLGVAYHLRVVQAAKDTAGGWWVRLSPTGRWLLGLAGPPTPEAVYTQTLLVQPNLEIIAYRQGLTPGLIGKLTRFAAWKGLGPACTLQLEPETVYRALEAGESFESIRLALEQHSTRAIPPAVLDSLRTWSNKRDRITVYPSATLLEFASAADLNEALARGLPGVRLADNLAVVVRDDAIDYRNFRLSGTRDYALPPEKCVSVEPDGVTLAVDPARSDLLLETELPRFAESVGRVGVDGRRRYRLTPTSLAAARASGMSVLALEIWFKQRTGEPLPPAARLLLTGSQAPPPQLQRHLVLHLAAAELADGLMQWPETRPLIEDRLGPTALAIAEENVGLLRERLRDAGITLPE